MNASSAASLEPFDTTAPDETAELRALVRALQLAEGFTLLLVRCNQPLQRQNLVAALREQLPDLKLQKIDFKEPITHLLDELRDRMDSPPPNAIFVSGLEFSMPRGDIAWHTAFIANLNAARNSFPQALSYPLVLWVPEYVLTAIMRGAPDFFSIRSGVYFFASSPEETSSLAALLLSDKVWQVDNLSLVEKQERVEAIRGLLEDYQVLPQSKQDYRAETRLLNGIAKFYGSQGYWKEAIAASEQALLIQRDLVIVWARGKRSIALVWPIGSKVFGQKRLNAMSRL